MNVGISKKQQAVVRQHRRQFVDHLAVKRVQQRHIVVVPMNSVFHVV